MHCDDRPATHSSSGTMRFGSGRRAGACTRGDGPSRPRRRGGGRRQDGSVSCIRRERAGPARASRGARARRSSRLVRSARSTTWRESSAGVARALATERSALPSSLHSCELRRSTRLSSCSRTSTGPTRRRSTASRSAAASTRCPPLLVLTLPRRRARPARTRSGIVLGELATGLGVDRSARASLTAVSRSSPSRRCRPRTSSTATTAGNPFFVTEVLASGSATSRRRSAMQSSRAPRV